jgi:hypothetical protein
LSTVAWDGRSLAADRQCCAHFKTRARKIFRLSDGRIFGGAGVFEQVLAVRDWLQDGGAKPEGLNEFSGILIESGTAYRLEEKLIRDRILERCHAVGSGAPFAITAMALGKTAREAVLIAARFDPRTGGGVDVLER